MRWISLPHSLDEEVETQDYDRNHVYLTQKPVLLITCKQKSAPHKDVYVLILDTREYVTLHNKRDLEMWLSS